MTERTAEPFCWKGSPASELSREELKEVVEWHERELEARSKRHRRDLRMLAGLDDADDCGGPAPTPLYPVVVEGGELSREELIETARRYAKALEAMRRRHKRATDKGG